jgi:hypothetical protein
VSPKARAIEQITTNNFLIGPLKDTKLVSPYSIDVPFITSAEKPHVTKISGGRRLRGRISTVTLYSVPHAVYKVGVVNCSRVWVFPATRIEPKAKYSSKMTVAVISLNTSPNICIYN